MSGPAPPNPPNPPNPPPAGSITPLFALVFLTALGLTVLSIGLNAALVFTGANSAAARDLADLCAAGWTGGTGAIFGLLGGKAL